VCKGDNNDTSSVQGVVPSVLGTCANVEVQHVMCAYLTQFFNMFSYVFLCVMYVCFCLGGGGGEGGYVLV